MDFPRPPLLFRCLVRANTKSWSSFVDERCSQGICPTRGIACTDWVCVSPAWDGVCRIVFLMVFFGSRSCSGVSLPDADLIMLSLLTHEPHFCLLREEVQFGPSRVKDVSSSSLPLLLAIALDVSVHLYPVYVFVCIHVRTDVCFIVFDRHTCTQDMCVRFEG